MANTSYVVALPYSPEREYLSQFGFHPAAMIVDADSEADAMEHPEWGDTGGVLHIPISTPTLMLGSASFKDALLYVRKNGQLTEKAQGWLLEELVGEA